jgi:hypothetical protein
MNVNIRIHIIVNKYASFLSTVFRMSHVVNLKNVFFHFVVSNYVCLFSLHEKNVWWLFFVLCIACVIWEIYFILRVPKTVVLFSSQHFIIYMKRMDCRLCSFCHSSYTSVANLYHKTNYTHMFLMIVVRLKNKNTLSSLLNL